MNKTPIIFAATALFVSTAALAGTDDFAKADVNKDGKVMFQELVVIMPSASEDKFKAADADGDGALSEIEFKKLVKM